MEGEEVFDGVDVEGVPFEFEALRVQASGKGGVECGLDEAVTFDFLEHGGVEEVIDFFVVDLKEGNVEGHFLGLLERLNLFNQFFNTPLHKPVIIFWVAFCSFLSSTSSLIVDFWRQAFIYLRNV